ncbi:unnamed protein product [Lathyrus sativus]|nr:unnamed protein product [Lathyrus sativus]
MESAVSSHVSEEQINISDMPIWAQATFRDRTQLNSVPSKVYKVSLFNRDNVLVRVPIEHSTPEVARLTILEWISRHKYTHDGSNVPYKILYFARTEASVVNIVRDILICFEDFNIKVGGHSEDRDIIVTTPLKWNSRIWKSNHPQMEIDLIIIYEIRFFNDVAYGKYLENIISRAYMQSSNDVRMVGLSAFPIALDIVHFLKVDLNKGYFDHEGIVVPGHIDDLLNDHSQHLSVSKLTDQLNSAIAIGTVLNAKQASLWLGCTCLYTRMVKNPSVFGLTTNNVRLEETRDDLINRAAAILEKTGLIKYDRKSRYFEVTNIGRIASYYSVVYGTISKYNEHLKPTIGDSELFHLISKSEEFKRITVRQDQKIEMAKFLNRIPIPITNNIEEPFAAKINFLIQAYISRIEFEDFTTTSEMNFIIQRAESLFRALFEIVLNRGWAQLTEKALNLCKAVTKRVWNV